MRGRLTLSVSSTGAPRHSDVDDTSTASSSNSSNGGPGTRSATLKPVIVAEATNATASVKTTISALRRRRFQGRDGGGQGGVGHGRGRGVDKTGGWPHRRSCTSAAARGRGLPRRRGYMMRLNQSIDNPAAIRASTAAAAANRAVISVSFFSITIRELSVS